MCTAITYKTNDMYFGRTLDYDFSYFEEVTVTPRNFPFRFRNGIELNEHYAIIGMACVVEDYPLYYDAVNEKGLCIAGLNFTLSACYGKENNDKINIAQFELVPWLLSRCASVGQVRRELCEINITSMPFNEELPAAKLHWMIADRNEAITVEAVKEGIKIYENPVGVLTNEPPFDVQLFRLNDYMHLSSRRPQNLFSESLDLTAYSRGMGALGLPGDLSSSSRFIRAAFVKMNSVSKNGEEESVGQFFHILGAVEQQRGCCVVEKGGYEITMYTSCCNADKGIYYYTTYNNHRITAVDMHKEDLSARRLIHYPLIVSESIMRQN